jgi:hypothetical protein
VTGEVPEVRRFGKVTVRIYHAHHYLETELPDGTIVPAAPHDTDEYRATAQKLGYGDDTWRLCREHELAHSELAEALGLEYSPTLWAVAHGQHGGIPGSPGEMAAEEDLVLAIQRVKCGREGELTTEDLKIALRQELATAYRRWLGFRESYGT